jgi:hypothetical protein
MLFHAYLVQLAVDHRAELEHGLMRVDIARSEFVM